MVTQAHLGHGDQIVAIGVGAQILVRAPRQFDRRHVLLAKLLGVEHSQQSVRARRTPLLPRLSHRQAQSTRCGVESPAQQQSSASMAVTAKGIHALGDQGGSRLHVFADNALGVCLTQHHPGRRQRRGRRVPRRVHVLVRQLRQLRHPPPDVAPVRILRRAAPRPQPCT